MEVVPHHPKDSPISFSLFNFFPKYSKCYASHPFFFPSAQLLDKKLDFYCILPWNFILFIVPNCKSAIVDSINFYSCQGLTDSLLRMRPPDGQTNLPLFCLHLPFCVRAALHSSCPGACVLFTKFVLLRHSSNPSKVFHCASGSV